MQLSFKEHFQPIVSQKLSDWKLQKSYMRKHTCHLHLRQRSLYVTIGQKNWVQKLIDNHKKKLLDSLEKKFQQPRGEVDKQNSSNQPNQSQGETSWSREIKEKSSHEEFCSSDRSGQPDITPSVIRAQTNLSGENPSWANSRSIRATWQTQNRTTRCSWSTSWDYDAQHGQ